MPWFVSCRLPRLTRKRGLSRPIRALLVFLAFPLFAFTQTSSPPSNTIHGIVLNSATREPIARALVTAGNEYAGFTDDQGRFSFALPANLNSFAGTFHAGRPGFLDDTGSNASVSISPNTTANPELQFTLTPESLITGRVTLPSAASFDRITVELYRRQVTDGRGRWISAATQLARTNGDFRFAGLAAGTYKVFTSELLDRDPFTADSDPDGPQFGYPPAYFPTATDFSSAAPITLATGQTFQAELTPTLRRYYQVKIVIPNARPGEGVNVTVAASNHYGPGFTLGFNGQDQAIEGMLPSGTYTVEAVSYGNSPASGVLSFTVHDAPVLTPTLLLLPSQSIPVNLKEELTAATGNSVSNGSTVFDRSGPMTVVKSGSHVLRRRFPALNLSLLPADDFSSHPVASLAPIDTGDSTLRVAGALPGVYWLQIYQSRGYVASATSGGVDLLLNPLVVAPGGSAAPIDITLRDDAAEIDGTIEDSSNDKAAHLQSPAVYCVPLPDSGGNFTQANVQANLDQPIRFQCPNLPPGSYRVLAFDTQQTQLEYRNPEAMRPYESKGSTVRLTGGQKESVTVSIAQP
jgi:hypothetical protein